MAELKTKPTGESVAKFLDSIEDDEVRKDCKAIARMMQRVSGFKPAMWRSGIVGFGSQKYRNTAGEFDWMKVGFAPRKQSVVLYLMSGFKGHEARLAKIGKHSLGKSCLYIQRLADMNLPALEALVRAAVKQPARGKAR